MLDQQLSQLKDLLKIHYGHSDFRLGQEQAIKSILQKKDTVVIMPTGGGKSLIYQLPALALDGVTLVISPLIALMKDQVDTLDNIGIPATFINSAISPLEVQNRITSIKSGEYKLVYIAPERFYSSSFLELLKEIKIDLFAIDEAHCISEWGHDFRPSYMRLRDVIKSLGNPTVAALTATATPEVKLDIIKQLDLQSPEVIVTGFNRPNLKFNVIKASDAQKYSEILNISRNINGSGIIYAGTRKKVEDILQYLISNGVQATGYHAGMDPEDRKNVQNEFMKDKTRIIIATNAFGLGIDKPNIRFVIHSDMPGTIEAYYQEAGRAGRDGQPSECTLLYSPADRYLREFFIKGDNPPPDVITQIYEVLTSYQDDVILATHSSLVEGIAEKVPDMAVGTALKILEREGYIQRSHEKTGLAKLQFLHDNDRIQNNLSAKAKVQQKVFKAFIDYFGDQLQSGVEFSSDEFAGIAGVKRDAITRLVKKLSDDNLADYTPPFRGTEIRVLNRVKAENLNINFSELKNKHKRELNKLDLMEGYIYSYGCRKKYILDYFEDRHDNHNCESCDNCLSGSHNNFDSITAADIPLESSSDTAVKLETKLTQLQTLELYEQGLDIDTMAQTRNLKPGTIIQHLCFLLEKNKAIDISKFIDAKKITKIQRAIKKIGRDKLSPIKEALDDDITWDEIRLVLAVK